MKKLKILGFIPAKGSSRGLKNKNTLSFSGKPLLYHSINFCKKIKDVTPFVSTDSRKILKLAKKNKISFDYIRPKKISTSKSKVVDAVIHALEWFEKKNITFEAVILLQPTSPLRDVKIVNKALNLFKTKKYSSLISVTKVKEHPYDCIEIEQKKWKFLRNNPNKNSNRQSYKKKYYFIDGSFYIATSQFLKQNKKLIIKKKTKIFITKSNINNDIDNFEDFKITETLFKLNKNKA